MQRRNYWIAGATAIVAALFLAPPIVKALGENLIDGNPVIITEGVLHVGDTASDDANIVAAERASAPSNPASGKRSLYPKSDGWYGLDSAGTEVGPFIDGTGVGDVTGPGSSTDNAIARFDGTTGKIIQNSSWTIDDSNVLSYVHDTDRGFSFNPTLDTLLISSATSGTSIQVQETGDTQYRLNIYGDGTMRWYEDAGSGTNYFEIADLATRSTTQSVIWPDDTPVNGDFLQWTTGGQLVWTAGGAGSSDNITSPDTNTHAYVYDLVTSGFQVTVEGTLMQKQLQTQANFYDDNIWFGDQLTADATQDIYIAGGTTSTSNAYRINKAATQISLNHDSLDLNTLISADNGEAFRVDGGTYGVGIGAETNPYSALSLDGGLQYGYTEKTSSFTYDPTAAGNDDPNVILLDCTTGSITVTLPNPDSTRSYNVTFIRVDSTVANDCIIDANSTWDIDGSDNIYIYEQWESYTLQAGSFSDMSGSTEWVITAHVEPHDRFMWDSVRVATTVANTYTVQPEDQFIPCSTAITAFTVTLPSAATYPGRRLVIKDYAGGAAARNITVSRAGSDTIDGATTQTISTNYGCLTLVSDGASVWMIEY